MKSFYLSRNETGNKWIIGFGKHHIASKPGHVHIYIDEGEKYARSEGQLRRLCYILVKKRFHLLLEHHDAGLYEKTGILMAASIEHQAALNEARERSEMEAPREIYHEAEHMHSFCII